MSADALVPRALALTLSMAVLVGVGAPTLAVGMRSPPRATGQVRITPGELAVMAAQTNPVLASTLRTALADGRPEMRMTAARVAGVSRIASLAGALQDALARETHEGAKREEQRALDLLAGRPGAATDTRTPTSLRTVSALFPGFLSSLLTASGCALSDAPSAAVISVRYAADGRPAGASVEASPSDGCATALRGLVAVTLADPGYAFVEGAEERLVLLLGREAVACADRPVVRTSIATAQGKGDVVQPVQTKDVLPTYPRAARNARFEGVVQVEAMLTATGCLRDAVVIGSADASAGRGAGLPRRGSEGVTGSVHLPLNTSLDFAALLAITQWQFTPAQVNGKPVDVVITLSSTFRLDRR
jgi:hypothetical protein